MQGIVMIVAYIILFGGLIYFMSIRPQKKQQKQMETLWASMAPGDSVITTSGFYGIILDVEFISKGLNYGNVKY